MDDRFNRAVLLFLALGVWILVLQNAGLIPPLKRPVVSVSDPIEVRGVVNIANTVEIDGEVAVSEIRETVNVNLSAVVGRDLVESKRGMYIGVSSADNKVIPIHWGEVSIFR